MKEKDFQSKFTKWIKDIGYSASAAFELKLCKEGEALAYSSFQPQQLPSLLKVKNGCLYRKISDADRGLKPYDASILCHAEAWVVAGWHYERRGIMVYMIDIDVFLAEQKQSTRKSLTEERAAKIANKHFVL